MRLSLRPRCWVYLGAKCPHVYQGRVEEGVRSILQVWKRGITRECLGARFDAGPFWRTSLVLPGHVRRGCRYRVLESALPPLFGKRVETGMIRSALEGGLASLTVWGYRPSGFPNPLDFGPTTANPLTPMGSPLILLNWARWPPCPGERWRTCLMGSPFMRWLRRRSRPEMVAPKGPSVFSAFYDKYGKTALCDQRSLGSTGMS